MDDESPIEAVRTLASGLTLGVGEDDGRFWVYDCAAGRVSWHRHVGPFPTWQQAVDWIEKWERPE